jgi:hypothetical protein
MDTRAASRSSISEIVTAACAASPMPARHVNGFRLHEAVFGGRVEGFGFSGWGIEERVGGGKGRKSIFWVWGVRVPEKHLRDSHRCPQYLREFDEIHRDLGDAPPRPAPPPRSLMFRVSG